MTNEKTAAGKEGGGGWGGSRDSTAIITDLLEEISTTQTGCPHHIEMIDSAGVCVCVLVRGGWHLAGGRVEAPGSCCLIYSPPHHPTISTNTSSALHSGLCWHGAGGELCGGGQTERGGFKQSTSLVKRRAERRRQHRPHTTASSVALISAGTGLHPPMPPSSFTAFHVYLFGFWRVPALTL